MSRALFLVEFNAALPQYHATPDGPDLITGCGRCHDVPLMKGNTNVVEVIAPAAVIAAMKLLPQYPWIEALPDETGKPTTGKINDATVTLAKRTALKKFLTDRGFPTATVNALALSTQKDVAISLLGLHNVNPWLKAEVQADRGLITAVAEKAI
mgnify:CR=1 FL=1